MWSVSELYISTLFNNLILHGLYVHTIRYTIVFKYSFKHDTILSTYENSVSLNFLCDIKLSKYIE